MNKLSCLIVFPTLNGSLSWLKHIKSLFVANMLRTRRQLLWLKIANKVKVDPITGCWEWQGRTDGKKNNHGGYGRVEIESATMITHRVAYTHFHGMIPHKKQVDHTCNNRLCCNPAHLEVVTHKQNHKRRVKRREESE